MLYKAGVEKGTEQPDRRQRRHFNRRISKEYKIYRKRYLFNRAAIANCIKYFSRLSGEEPYSLSPNK